MAPAILERVTGRSGFSVRPAILARHRRHRVKAADYPAVVPVSTSDSSGSHGDSSVRGTYVSGLTAKDIYRLDLFEGDEYDRVPVRVTLLPLKQSGASETLPPPAATDGKSAAEYADCQTYIWKAPRSMLEESEWDFEEFTREKLWRWAPGGEREQQGEYRYLDEYSYEEAVAAQNSDDDPTRGRAVGGAFDAEVRGRS